jgi:hypothetical protein
MQRTIVKIIRSAALRAIRSTTKDLEEYFGTIIEACDEMLEIIEAFGDYDHIIVSDNFIQDDLPVFIQDKNRRNIGIVTRDFQFKKKVNYITDEQHSEITRFIQLRKNYQTEVLKEA